jgi:hypothetical protein
VSLRFFAFHERPELEQRKRPLLEAWPACMFEDPVAGERWHLLYQRLGRFQYFRLDARLGAKLVRPCPESTTIAGPVSEWEKWTNMLSRRAASTSSRALWSS